MKTKKITAGIVAGVLAVTCLSGCGATENPENATSDSKKIQITYLNGFTGGDGGFMKKLTDGFNASQDKYEVIESQEKDHLTQFKANGADIVAVGDADLFTFATDGMIQEVSDIYTEAEISEDDFLEVAMEAAKVDGKTYGFPLDIYPLTMFYNKELVSEEEVPKTYDDLVALNAKVQAQDSSTYALAIPGAGLVENYWMASVTQSGIELEKDGYCNFAQEEVADVFMKWHDAVFADKMSPANLGLDAEFTSFAKTADDIATSAAASLTGVWYYNTAAEVFGDNLGVAGIPVFGEGEGTYGGAHNLVVSSEVTDEDKLLGIAEFMKYVYTPENLLVWAESGQTPVHKETMNEIRENPEKYPVPAVNVDTVEKCGLAPRVYNSAAQTKYVTDNIWGKVVSQEDLTKDDLMKMLEEATENAKQLAAQ